MKYALVLVLLCLFGCNRAPPPRQVADTTVPPHAHRERFLGKWQDPDTSVLVVAALPDGSVAIQWPLTPGWDHVINNVHWEGDRLCFDAYDYSSPPNGGHKGYDGSRNKIVLSSTEDRNRLKKSVEGEEQPGHLIESEYKRAGG